MSTFIEQQIQDLQAQIAGTAEEIAALEEDLRVREAGLANHLSQRAQYQLLEELCSTLEKLARTSAAASLFREATGNDAEKELQHIRAVTAEFKRKTSSMESACAELKSDIRNKQSSLKLLGSQLSERQGKAERLKKDPMHDMPYRVLPWSHHGGDERRFHLILFSIVSFTIAFGGLIPYFRQPVVESKGVIVPERIARIIKKKQEAKKEESRRLEKLAEKQQEAAEEAQEKLEKKAGKPEEKIAAEPSGKPQEAAPVPLAGTPAGGVDATGPAPVETETQRYRRSAESKGVLAFKGDLANLLKDTNSSKMGADAHISVNSKRTTGDALQRSIAVTQETGSSGGIDTSAIKRQSEGVATELIAATDIKFSRVESSSVTTATAGATGKAGKGSSEAAASSSSQGGGARTDEEIQIVFDQYKSTLYRMYNRELRTNPGLRGRMVLRIVIEADGRVSACTVKTNEMTSPEFADAIVKRVLNFNFGPKPGAPAVSILYPIEFLPAN